ncbi:chlorophyllase-1-like protein [Cinnamomum micranthum f. kanehirae]|uniref:Chlorophyllase-1-like protein n=1 Tax=Cinnamomum micranthum f. kanehirae TaxID=337451 RepID=A0A3S3NBI0_9MAGN|nr:chlorophyllase-1-like protein [Cinnamomum micranthum f. kanehirae]
MTVQTNSGLGEKPKMWMMPTCAPEVLNHKSFFCESKSPCCYFVTKEYGHMDMLDDNTKMMSCMSASGEGSRKTKRAFLLGGLSYWDCDSGDLKDVLQHPEIAPVKLNTPISPITNGQHGTSSY